MIANTILLLATLALATTAVAGDGGETAADVEARQRVLSWVETASHFLRDVTDLVPSPHQALEDSHQTVADAAFFGLHVGTKPYRSTSSKPSPRDAAADLDDHATVEERQGQFLIRTIESVQRWWSGEALSPRKTATRPNRRSPAADHQLWASNDALSTLHLRAAEEYAELKRYGGAAAASAYPSDAIDAPRFTDGYYNTGDDDEINAISDRSRRKLVSLLRWRRSQRDHRQPPNLGPDHVPHYAKEIAARLRGDVTDEPSARIQRRSFNAQQSQDYSTGSTYAYCQDGLTVYPSSVNFTCNTSSTRKANFTAAQVALQPPSVRSTCVPLSSRRACICPRDSIQGRTVYGDVVCYWRDVTCTTAPLDPPACPQGPASEPLGIDKCVTIQRRSIFQFSINVTCRWKWANPADYAFYGVTLVPDPPASEQFLVLNTTNTSQPIIKNLTGYRIAAFGTAREIMDDVFIYTAEPSTSVMPLTSVHPSVGQYSFYARPVNFNALSDRSQQQSIYLGEAPYEVGQITGDVPVTFTIDFSGVPDSFLTANRAYIEVGLRGGKAVVNPDQVMGAQWTVDFLDVVDPPVKNRNPSNVTTIIIAVTVSLGVTLIIGIIIGIYCYRKRADKAKEKEEDRLLDD